MYVVGGMFYTNITFLFSLRRGDSYFHTYILPRDWPEEYPPSKHPLCAVADISLESHPAQYLIVTKYKFCFYQRLLCQWEQLKLYFIYHIIAQLDIVCPRLRVTDRGDDDNMGPFSFVCGDYLIAA